MNYYDFLEEELVVAYGCTEPIAIAYASAVAVKTLGEEPEKLIANLSSNMIKNANSVKVPSTDGRKGIPISVVAGAFLGDADRKLEVLEDIDKTRLSEMDDKIKNGVLDINLVRDVAILYIEIIAKSGKDQARVVIEDGHTNITLIEKNKKLLFQKKREETDTRTVDLSIEAIYEFANNCDLEKLKPILDRQINYNIDIAKEGLINDYGSNIGKLVNKNANTIYSEKLVANAAAASDARMSGSEKPVVINSGSGNQGITVSVPVIIFARDNNISDEKLYRALVFSNLIALYMKQGIGKLSAYCGVVSAAGAAACGIAYLKDDSKKVIAETLVNTLATNSGLICDGAKASCASKIASSLRNAFLSYDQAKTENTFESGDGIVKDEIEKTLDVVSHIAKYGMKKTDEVILSEMIENRDYLKEF